ncbi:MAG: D-hexose-6-phosphate mutarotase [Gammaproteobacteria bacterium]|nr:D-hexose-6-phosphate mutarotase [Gammaproteobacteria bacterium]
MTYSKLNTLQQQFSNCSDITFTESDNGMIIIHIKNKQASASICLQGAHILTFQPNNQEPVIWLSEEAKLAPGKSIRGGVPICWPWFGAHSSDSSLPTHGYARTTDWQLIQVQSLTDGRTQLEFEFSYSPTLPLPLSARYIVTIGTELDLKLISTNVSDTTIQLSNALHTYFQVGDVRDIRIHGLDGCEYIDTLVQNTRHTQDAAVIIDQEVDRIYLNTPRVIEIRDPGLNRRLCIHSRNSHSAIVWNPWIAKSERMGDLGKDGYLNMLCIETANAADDTVTLAPKAQHQLSAIYSIASL